MRVVKTITSNFVVIVVALGFLFEKSLSTNVVALELKAYKIKQL